MEFWHIILVATIIGIVILGLILAILFCCSNERNEQGTQNRYARYDIESQKEDNRNQRILILKKKGSLGSNIPNFVLQKHFFEENEDVNANEALLLSKSRVQTGAAPSGCYLTQNTVFENPSRLWKCTVVGILQNLSILKLKSTSQRSRCRRIGVLESGIRITNGMSKTLERHMLCLPSITISLMNA